LKRFRKVSIIIITEDNRKRQADKRQRNFEGYSASPACFPRQSWLRSDQARCAQLVRQQPQVRLALLLRFFPEAESTIQLFLRLVDEVLWAAPQEDCCTADHIRQIDQFIQQAKAARFGRPGHGQFTGRSGGGGAQQTA
jgi:hypothetical protein